MKRLRVALVASGLIALGWGCGSAKEALEEAAGISQMSETDVTQILTDSGAKEKLSKFKIHGGFNITANFPADLTSDQSVDVPISMPKPEKFDPTKGKARSILFLRAREFEIAGTKMTRLEVVTVAKVEPTSTGATLSLQGGKFTEHLDVDQKVTKATQAGKYILAEGEGTGGLVFYKGESTLKKQDATSTLVKGAFVYSDSSPFITQTSSTGQFLLPVPEGSSGSIMAYHNTIDADYTAPGTPKLATTAITKAGLLDEYKGDVSGKLDESGISPADKSKAMDGFDKVNTFVTDFFDAWTVIPVTLVFIQPPQTPPAPPPAPPKPAQVADPAPRPSATAVVITGTDSTEPQVDLGCTGVDASGNSTFVTNGANFDNYTTYKGWRVSGNVIASTEQADVIFGDPTTLRANAETASRYPDQAKGYCVLSTGNALYTKQTAADSTKDNKIYQPGPAGAEQVTEMWQKVKTPAKDSDYKYIKIRVAFFSQEFPAWVGSGYNDSFFVKFDESPDFIGTGNLNDLAGGESEVSGCKSKTFASGTKVTCGEWQSIAGGALSTGVLWDIDKSTNAVSQGSKYFCGSTGKCYHGYIPARVICKQLNAETEMGKELTLRFNVTDAGDKMFDSALAIDSIVFSKEDCGASAFAGDARSKARQE